jgi:hypothetical protein
MSESLRQLDRDAQRWIENEISHVTQVMTVKMYPHRQEIIFAIWSRTARRRAEKDDEIHIGFVKADRGLEIMKNAYASPSIRSLSDRLRGAPLREM